MRLSPETSKENCLIIEMVDGNITRCRGYSLKDLFQLPPQDIDSMYICARIPRAHLTEYPSI